MRTLLVSLAFMVMVSGCAATVPRGMENIRNVNDLSVNSGNHTQPCGVDIESADRAAQVAIWAIDALAK